MSSHVRSATGTVISCLPFATPVDRPATLATFSVSSFLATICLISSSIGFVVSFTYSTQASGPPLPFSFGLGRRLATNIPQELGNTRPCDYKNLIHQGLADTIGPVTASAQPDDRWQ